MRFSFRKFFPHTRYQVGAALFFLLVITYAVEYGGRGLISTSMTSIMADTGFTKSTLGSVGMGFFLAYGTMQLVVGPIADKVAPQILVGIGLFFSGVFTILTGISTELPMMAIFWTLNGFAQSMIWPPVIRVIAEWMPKAQRAKSGIWVSAANPLGAVLLYIISAVVFTLTGWRVLFYIFGGMLLFMAFFSYSQLKRLKRKLDETVHEDEPDHPLDEVHAPPVPKVSIWWLIFKTGVPFLCLIGFIMGFIREGIATWAPTFLVENYHLDSVQAVLMTSVLPIVNLSGAWAAAFMLKRTKSNEPITMALMFLIAAGAIGVLILSSGGSAFVGVLFLALTTASQLGSGSIITMIPIYFSTYNRTATIMSVINFCVFAGTALASYGFGAVADKFGWNATMLCWLATAIVGVFVSFLLIKPWNRFKEQLPIE